MSASTRSLVQQEVSLLESEEYTIYDEISNTVKYGLPPDIRAANTKASTIRRLNLNNKVHFKAFTKPRNTVQPYYTYVPNRNEEEDDDLESVHSEDLVYALCDAKKLEKPHFESSRSVYLASLKKPKVKETISPLVPKDLDPRQLEKIASVVSYRHLSNSGKKGARKPRRRSSGVSVSPISKFVGRRQSPKQLKKGKYRIVAKGEAGSVDDEPIDWNNPEYVNTPNLFYKCSNPNTFFKGSLNRSKLSTLLKDRPLTSHAEYNIAVRNLQQTVLKGQRGTNLSAYNDSGVLKPGMINPNTLLPGSDGTETELARRLELSILRHIASRERYLKELKACIASSKLVKDGTYAVENAIRNAKVALRPKKLALACDNIRNVTVKIIMEIDKWRRACEAGLRSIAETYHNLGIKTKPPLSKVVERGNPSEERMVSSPFALMTPGMTPAGMQAGATPLYTGTASPMGGMPALPPQTPHESCGFGNEQETIGVQEGLSTPALLAPASAHLTTGDNDIDADSHLLRLLESSVSSREFEIASPYCAKRENSTVEDSELFSRIMSPPRPFLYKGENYIYKMRRDVEFLDTERIGRQGMCVSEILGLFPAAKNPLLYTSSIEHLCGNASVAAMKYDDVKSKQFRRLDMMTYRESASILMDDYRYLQEVSIALDDVQKQDFESEVEKERLSSETSGMLEDTEAPHYSTPSSTATSSFGTGTAFSV